MLSASKPTFLILYKTSKKYCKRQKVCQYPSKQFCFEYHINFTFRKMQRDCIGLILVFDCQFL